MKQQEHHVIFIYDSITNSVFNSQVMQPIFDALKVQNNNQYHIISFEKKNVTPPQYNNIHFKIVKQYPYIGTWSLWPAIRTVRQYIKLFSSYRITARGPFAGYIALRAVTKPCNAITIQARGLAAQEYAYAHKEKTSWLTHLRSKLLHNLEKTVYSTRHNKVSIESVSLALKQYLVSIFGTDADRITIAQHDIPPVIDTIQRLIARTTIRTQLNINDDATVYCYSGSYKPWQCPEQTIDFFQKRYAHDARSFLLILTPESDIPHFNKLLQALPKTAYHICHINQHQLFHYLAAADFGLLLREQHIINYVARPTKALEYHAAGLTILHNGTVEYIKSMQNQQNLY